jgi:hypothetical protein
LPEAIITFGNLIHATVMEHKAMNPALTLPLIAIATPLALRTAHVTKLSGYAFRDLSLQLTIRSVVVVVARSCTVSPSHTSMMAGSLFGRLNGDCTEFDIISIQSLNGRENNLGGLSAEERYCRCQPCFDVCEFCNGFTSFLLSSPTHLDDFSSQ